MKIGKIVDGSLFIGRDRHTEEDINNAIAEGFLPIEEGVKPELGRFETTREIYVQLDDKIIVTYETSPNNPAKINIKIAELKAELVASDYKWRKISEAQYKGAELPYDPNVLIAESDAKREQINELEQLISCQ